jgi:3-deoxy-D-manno-octulosonic-acid transferase
VDPLIFFHGIYQTVGGLVAVPTIFWTALTGRHGGQWLDRLGYVVAGGNKPLWLHASSVGEAGSAIKLLVSLKEILPDQKYVLSLGTPGGLKYAENIIRDDPSIQLIASPLDVWGSPGRALDRMDPKALILMEAEIWPGLIRKCFKRKIPIILASGRVSEKSWKRYNLIRSFFRQLFNFMDLITVISSEDESRLRNLGVNPEKIIVMGNPKYDGLIKIAREEGPPPINIINPLLIVAGSTHPGEEEIIISALLKVLINSAAKKGGESQGDSPPPFKLIIAPRHVERAERILALAERSGFSAKLISDPNVSKDDLPEISVVNVLGKLGEFYSKADVAIVGGSFVAGYSGHNPLEPASYGRPVVFGPNMESFNEPARALMDIGAAKMCLPQELHNVLFQISENPSRPRASGQRGKNQVAGRTMVGPVIANAIKEIVFDHKTPIEIAKDSPPKENPPLSLELSKKEDPAATTPNNNNNKEEDPARGWEPRGAEEGWGKSPEEKGASGQEGQESHPDQEGAPDPEAPPNQEGSSEGEDPQGEDKKPEE